MELKQISIPISVKKVNVLDKLRVIELAKNFLLLIKSYFDKLLTFFSTLTDRKNRKVDSNELGSMGSNLSRTNKRNYKKTIKLVIPLLLVFGFLYVGTKIIQKLSFNSKNNTEKVEIKGAKAVQDLNKEFSFPLLNEKGEEISRIKYVVEKAEIRDEIIVKGKTARAVKGRTFLIITLKVSNDFRQPVEINTKDYLRLSLNNNEDEWFAPDTHNDPVEVQAISTEPVILGFAVNETDKNLLLRVGEINGEKEKIELNL